MKENGKETTEEICVQRFLNWYNTLQSRNYTYERATDCFTDLKDKLNWDFIAFERTNPQEWIGIEVKELYFLRKETSVSFTFWERLCSDLTKDLLGKGIQGEFEISVPPVLDLTGKRQKFLEAFSRVLIDKQSGWKVGETKDIGPDVRSRFPNWPKEKSEPFDEYDKWGTDRPCKLEITKVSDSGCKVSMVDMCGIGDVVEEDKKAFNEVFKLKNGLMQPDRQLELAKGRGARKTILLLANIGVDEDNTRNFVQNCLDHELISHIDCIYLVDMGNEDGVAKIYPI